MTFAVAKTEPGEKKKPAEGSPVRKAGHARLRLPFDDRRGDAGEWAYDHRIGLAVTVIAYLLIGIAFVGGKVVAGRKSTRSTIVVDLQTLAQLEAERDRLQREVESRSSRIDWGSIRNDVSNENALNEKLADDRGTDASRLNESAEQVERRMRANREAYEKGVAEARAMGEKRGGSDDGSANRQRPRGA